MSKAWFLLVLVLAWPGLEGRGARAEPFAPGQTLNQVMVAEVVATALDFMAPRTLEAIPLPQMVIWGLRGLTTLDPRLAPDLQRDSRSRQTLRLTSANRVLASRAVPADGDALAWGEATALLVRAAWDNSEAVRKAGTGGILRSFFDELFNHLDPYSRYMSPAEARAEQELRIGRASVGLRISLRGGQAIVQSVQPGGPASLAGVRPGERILEIDGEPTQGADLQALAALLAGPEETVVAVTLRGPDPRLRDGSKRVVLLRREALPEETVFAARRHDLLVLRISGFARNTAARLAQELIAGLGAVPSPSGPPPLGVIIDLRGNRGGLLRQAVAAAAMLQPTGLVAITAGRDPEAAHEFRADGRDLAQGLPVIVVVDGRSASAAEIMAAALADQRRAVVVGSTTLGKGLVQTIVPLPDGGELFVTWSRVLAPRGWPIQGLGLVPQLCTSLGTDALNRNIEALMRGVQPLERGLARHRAARAPIGPAEALEIRAICPAAEGADLDLVAADQLIRHPMAYATALLPMAPAASALGAANR